jgi:hypothetical protein
MNSTNSNVKIADELQDKPSGLKNIAIETVGWVGMALILYAFYASSNGILSTDSKVYQSINLVGSVGLIVVSWVKRAYQPALLNIVWTLISAIALLSGT